MTEKNSPLEKKVLLSLLVNHKERDLVENTLEKLGCFGYFGMLAQGTSRPSLWKALGLKDAQRLHYQIPLYAFQLEKYTTALHRALEVSKAGAGISYQQELDLLLTQEEGADPGHLEKAMEDLEHLSEKEGEKAMYQKITVITDLGKAEEAMEAARSAGAMGGTILHGHGSVGEHAGKLFGIRIVPEKEMLVIIAPAEKTAGIVRAMAEKMDLEKPGTGILYVEKLLDAKGLVD